MRKTKIPWADFSINPIKGLCPMACPYCYARRMYKRFKWDETIRFDRLGLDASRKGGAKIFVGSTMELFGDWIKVEWLESIFKWCRIYEEDTFIFLTKRPENLARWSPFPRNVWVGTSVTNHEQLIKASVHLAEIEAQVKFASVEPMLPELDTLVEGYWLGLSESVNWLIFGCQTQPVRYPKAETIRLAIDCADYTKVPVFVKEPMASHYNIHRQEFPCVFA